jgi:tetratricopeptide (TPR) repeat protein
MNAKQTTIKMQSFSQLKLGFGLIAACLMTSPAKAQNNYWQEFGNQPVFIEQNNNGRIQLLKFIDYRDEMIVAEMEMRSRDGTTTVAEIAQPVTEGMVKNLDFKTGAMEAANRFIDNQNYTAAAKVLRPQVYPLIKFYRIPETFIQLHQPVRLMLETLIEAGELKEAEDLLARIELDKVDFKYSEIAQALLLAYKASESFDALARVAVTLPVSADYLANINVLTDAANSLRSAGQYNAVIPIYRTIQAAANKEQKKDIDLWLAYSLVLADRLEEAAPLIDALDAPEPSERLFSLYKLLHGSRMHRLERYSEALDMLTRGFVRAQTAYSWVPEMLYLIGDCYLRANDPIAARNVWFEVTILYPQSPWATRVQKELDALPNPSGNL